MLSVHCQKILQQLPSHRLLALDVMRGLTIATMILVNNPGSWLYLYWPLKHADWHGLTPTDLIFPFFIFIVGMSITLSVNAMQAKEITKRSILRAGVIRTLKLIALGWFLALFYYNFRDPNFSWLDERLAGIRIMGVLQRIGLVYLVALACYLYIKPRYIALTFVNLLIGYGTLMVYMPYSLPNGEIVKGLWLHSNNLSAWLDNLLLGAQHVYYANAEPLPFDPEGLLSTLPAIATALSGVLCGYYISTEKNLGKQVKIFTIVAITSIVCGCLLSFVTPINKALWTPSYVMISSGLAMLCYALCSYILDIRKVRLWCAPFLVFGANAILFFMFAGVVARILIMIPVGETSLKGVIFSKALQPLLGNYMGSFAFSVLFLLLSYAVMYACYKRRIFWKV
ncbi:heparan-alpha-glucosaminide N-acetyltransferase domain-containing protein [Pseudoalteromonas sp. KG3]|uniref:acyltransferase family protein n=2 Tax=Pseudoalteromonas TaxID=53246 RepID=UPI0026596ED0|nr:heparan-alpha-glucosaminide N-acetyltransferase domain-containing protein [Pseudoalteromonas sp. KG3]WKD25612.1 heparan-alpha-glucosaminide N-acetyltransferase domain-containing protein [Pseudoalteromonas sp. KG3]